MREKLAGLLLALLTTHAAAQQCTLIGKYENNSVPVFRTSDGLITFKTNVDVNTDGALQSYKIDDLGFFLPDGRLQTNSALNTICNGVNIRRANHSLLFSASQCKQLLTEFKRIRDFGWLKDGENYVDFYAIALMPGTQTQGKNRGKPCEKDGFYVSQVAKAMDSGKPVCDPDHWVDALRIPAIVLPLDQRLQNAGANLHDLVIMRLADGKRVGAIVGDTNPAKIGEATVIANMRLKGIAAQPANYRATVGLVIPSAQYVVFPGTRNLIPNLSNASDADIQTRTKQLFDQFNLGQRPQLCP